MNKKQLTTLAIVAVVGYLLYSGMKQQQAAQQNLQGGAQGGQTAARRFRG